MIVCVCVLCEVDLAQWLEFLGAMPALKAALDADFNAEIQEFGKFRSRADELAKLEKGQIARVLWKSVARLFWSP